MQFFIDEKYKRKRSFDSAHFILGSFPQDEAKELHSDRVSIEDESSQILYTKKFQNLNNSYEFLLCNAV